VKIFALSVLEGASENQDSCLDLETEYAHQGQNEFYLGNASLK